MGWKETFRQQGGGKLLGQYARSGALGTAVGEFALLGGSRTALEILRLSAQLKVKQRLERQYRGILEAFDRDYDSSLRHESSNKVWLCWLQGLDKAPVLVQKCCESVRTHLTDREIIVITAKNMGQYVRLPDFILEKWKAGEITNTHLTDLLRLELLIRYGGLWLDATVFCSEGREKIPDYFFDSELFFFQSLKPGRDGKAFYPSSWLICAKSNNKPLMATRELCYAYWKTHRRLDEYYLLHAFLSLVLDYYPQEWRQVIPRDNAAPHLLLLRLFESYDERLWQAIKAQSPFHKLSYKLEEALTEREGTYYRRLFADAE